MYAAVPETVGRSGREPAAVRDGTMKSNIPHESANNRASQPTRNPMRNPARHSARSPAR
jgi:hypothetical protein